EGEVRIGSNVKIGYLSQQVLPNMKDVTILDAFRHEVNVIEGQARQILAKFLFYGHAVFKKLSQLSRSEEHTSELQSRFDLVCRLQPSSTLFPYTTLFRSEGEVRIGSNVKIGYLSQQVLPNMKDVTILDAFRHEVNVIEGQARQILAKFLFYGHAVFKKLSQLS